MSLPTTLLKRLADELHAGLGQAAVGHCVRVDHLSREDGEQLCRLVRTSADDVAHEAYVLTTDTTADDIYLLPEQAIEIRNRKQTRLCLFVPAGSSGAAASSLANSFAEFDLEATFARAAKELLDELPGDIRAAAIAVREQLRGPAAIGNEHWADYLASLVEDQRFERVGRDLWRVGLIPDAGGDEDLVGRLRDNRRCILALARPATAQSSLSERIGATGLRPGEVRDALVSYLSDARLRDTRSWLEPLTADDHWGQVTFEQWVFESSEQSDLEAIDVEPLLDADGEVQKYTGLAQPSGPGSQPVAGVGPKRKMTVKWLCHPSSPTSVAHWKAELIAAREEYTSEEAAEADLPSAMTTARSKRISVPLDVDLESTTIRAVQVRVIALDEQQAPIASPQTNEVIEGLSGEFWLETDSGLVESDGGTTRRDTVPTLPFARVKAAVGLKADTLTEAPGQWNERELHYFEVTLNGRQTNRVGLSPVLRAIQQTRIESDAEGSFRGHVSAGNVLALEAVTFVEADSLAASELGEKLRSRRRDVFRQLRAQEHRGLVETADWTADLARAARSYAVAFRETLSRDVEPELLAELLCLDTLHLKLEHPHGTEEAMIVLPTHPLRLLWYSAYAELLREWEQTILGAAEARSKLLDLDLLERVAPVNVPAFVPWRGKSVFLFAQNLAFFWGLLLPAEAHDPARRVSDVAGVVGLPADEALLADLPPKRLAGEFHAYREIHPYLEALRLSVLNPGSGAFLVAALRDLFAGAQSSDEDGSPPAEQPLRLELLAHAHKPLPIRLPVLERFQRDLYQARAAGRFSHLAPLCSLALRSISDSGDLPGGEVNMSVAFDISEPRIETVEGEIDQDSASFYGLLTRLLSTFEASEAGARWEHRASLPLEAARERHPVSGAYTSELVGGHRAYLEGISRLRESTDHGGMPAVVAELLPEDRTLLDSLHEASDWVVFLDRFLGVDFFDYPQNADLARVSRRYLLDYAPEFLEGLGHRMIVTTSHREEVTEILGRAMQELGFGSVEESVGEVLDHLKKISGRLALRIIGDDARAREAVSLGVVAAYLQAQGELQDSILIPVDSHHEIFGLKARRHQGTPRARCDLVRVRFQRGPLLVTFIEVKSRGATGHSEELSNRIVDQIEATEEVFRELFFRKHPPRLDHVLQRSRLATILRFYLQRAWRHGLISSEERLREFQRAIARLESGVPEMRAQRWGFVVNLSAQPERPVKLRDTEIRLITATDLASAGIPVSESASPGASPKRRAAPSADMRDADEDAKDRSGGPDSAAGDAAAEEPTDAPTERETAADGVDTASAAVGADTRASSAPGEDERDQPSDRHAGLRPSDAQPPPHDDEEQPPRIAVELGTSAFDQHPIRWQPSVRGSPHLFILGIPGQGKSWTITRLLIELHRQGLSALVFDFHGQFADAGSHYAEAASPAILDASRGLPFSPFEAEVDAQAGPSFWRTNAFVVAEIFEYVCGLGDIQRDVVYEAVRDCYVALGFEDGKPARLPTVREVAERLGELERERSVRNVVPRCRPLLEFGLFADDGVAPATDGFSSLLRGGAVLDVSNQGLEELQLAAGAFVLRKIYKEMFHWGETSRLRLVLVLDEAHRLARDITLPKIMKEGRKFGVAVVVASQGLADFHPDVVGNAGSKVVFRTNFPMSKRVAGYLRARKGTDLAAEIEQLEVGEAYVQTPEMAHYARVRMHPLDSHRAAPAG